MSVRSAPQKSPNLGKKEAFAKIGAKKMIFLGGVIQIWNLRFYTKHRLYDALIRKLQKFFFGISQLTIYQLIIFT